MSDLWKQCEGQFVDNRFPLLQFIGNTNHSAVFRTELAAPHPSKAAIKFISADIPAPDRQLAIWQQVESLSHPHLLKLFLHGRCRLAGMELLYVIMELADENLAQFLPKRPLNPQEARDVLDPLVDALVHLHGQSLSHAHVKPSNLLAIDDQLKLSSDTILPVGDSREAYRDHDVYDAPENSASTIHASTAADIWSLGVTLVETLTQQAPSQPFEESAEPMVPDALPQPFLEIARHSLLHDASRRWTIAGIAEHLNPAPPLAAAATAAATSAASASTVSSPAPPAPATIPPPQYAAPVLAPLTAAPHSLPLATEPAVPLKKLPVQKIALPRRDLHFDPDKTISLPSYVIPALLAIVLLLGAVFTLPKIFRSLPTGSAATASSAAPTAPKPAPVPTAKTATPAAVPSPAASPAQNTNKPALEAKAVPPPARTVVSEPIPVVRPATSSASKLTAKASADSPTRGDVLDQVLPEASGKALATIHGTVRVLVRVHVDPAGNVSSAELDSPGPSKYFADLALRAAQRWQFASPVSEGHSLPSHWLIRFEFSPTGVIAVPQQSAP